MAIKKLTFDEALNTAKNDAYFNYYLTNKKNGIFYDLGNRCQASTSNGIVTFKDGFVSVYGRRIYIENGTGISVSLNKTCKGYVILYIDTIQNNVTLALREGTSTNYPALTQTNLLTTDGVYEFPLVGYSKTTTSLTLDTSVISYLYTNQTLLSNESTTINNKIDSNYNTLDKKIDSQQHGIKTSVFYYTSLSGKRYGFNVGSLTSEDGLVTFSFCNNAFAVSLSQLRSITQVTITYTYLGATYNGYVERSGNYIYVTTGETGHQCKYIQVSY